MAMGESERGQSYNNGLLGDIPADVTVQWGPAIVLLLLLVVVTHSGAATSAAPSRATAFRTMSEEAVLIVSRHSTTPLALTAQTGH